MARWKPGGVAVEARGAGGRACGRGPHVADGGEPPEDERPEPVERRLRKGLLHHELAELPRLPRVRRPSVQDAHARHRLAEQHLAHVCEQHAHVPRVEPGRVREPLVVRGDRQLRPAEAGLVEPVDEIREERRRLRAPEVHCRGERVAVPLLVDSLDEGLQIHGYAAP
ncbi:MAG: hypothetical protein FJZ00_12055 [Candidatus Sericytochromatia bacterium]|uniref:Uncharacterized protein n=1 Tax=Candidatus Tanganyikabacteria bacterium TaxID=2961651 RepID=A0A937X857_9BACT|nr:hypothetical protein [Candidatus Tanganyikabacteria bacterium]